MYDVTDLQSFQNVTAAVRTSCAQVSCMLWCVVGLHVTYSSFQWASEITSNAPPDIVKLLVGTKSDLTTYRVVSKESGQGAIPCFPVTTSFVSARSLFPCVRTN